LARLSALGLLDIYAQRGTIVSPLRLRDLRKSQFLREALEVALLPRAIASPNRPQLLIRLNNELALQETLAAIGDDKRFYSSDELFHSLIATYADIGDIWGDISAAKLHMDRFRHLTFPTVDGMPVVIGQHRLIVAAIEKGDAGEAAAAMRAHLRRIFSALDLARGRFPGYFAGEHAARGMATRDLRPAPADETPDEIP
jgi:DNA-binding GntR family transcriptional regulator